MHSPLPNNHIRFVYLLPAADPADIVSCRSTHDKENSCRHYEALSYTWGDIEDGVQTIRVNSRPFLVRSSLWHFLKQLRGVRTSRTLWIDALCSDQDSIQERNHQIGRMRQIFSNAVRTIALLGPPDRKSDTTFVAMQWQHGLS